MGPHPETGEPVTAGSGFFGPFVSHRGVFASIAAKSSGWTPFSVTLGAALELFEKKSLRVAAREAKGLQAWGGREALKPKAAAVKAKAPKRKLKGLTAAAAAAAATAFELDTAVRRLPTAESAGERASEPQTLSNDTSSQPPGMAKKQKKSSKFATAGSGDPVPALDAKPAKRKASSNGGGDSGTATAAAATRLATTVPGLVVVKQSTNPYLRFSAVHRQRVKHSHPSAKPAELVSLLAAEWRELSQGERDSYTSLAGDPAPKVAKAGLDQGGSPKPTLSSSNPYLQFSAVNRQRVKEQHPSAKPSQLMSLLAAEWRAMEEGERALYRSSVVA